MGSSISCFPCCTTHGLGAVNKQQTKPTNNNQNTTTNQAENMSEEHFDEFEHYNFDKEKAMKSGQSGKQRSSKEAEQHTNRHNPGGHERKIVTKLMNAENNTKAKAVKSPGKDAPGGQ